MTEDFRRQLFAHAQSAMDRAGRAVSEAATQQYLVLPFIQLLGYDPLDPDEVIPEAHASFSDKFKNRVDYAICQNGQPVIAIECKKVGTLAEANRGELKGYFNAVPTVKLGILTDGLVYQLFTDTGLENMMDDEPFALIDLSEVSREQINDVGFDALLRLRKGTFDPANVGTDARRKMYLASYVDTLERNFEQPDERLVRVLMDIAGVDGRRTGRLVEEHGSIISSAVQVLFDKKILARVGFAERQDLVRMRPEIPTASPPPQAEEVATSSVADEGVVTTETEQFVYDYVRRRLPFLIDRDEGLFEKISQVKPMDYKTVFSVFYKQERKGKLFNFRENTTGPRYRFEFVALGAGNDIVTDTISEIDERLLAAFMTRVQELG